VPQKGYPAKKVGYLFFKHLGGGEVFDISEGLSFAGYAICRTKSHGESRLTPLCPAGFVPTR